MEVSSIVLGVLSVVCLFQMLLIVFGAIFLKKLYQKISEKQAVIFRLVDFILEINVYMTEQTKFLNGELADKLSASSVPQYQEIRRGLDELRDFIRLFATASDELRSQIVGD